LARRRRRRTPRRRRGGARVGPARVLYADGVVRRAHARTHTKAKAEAHVHTYTHMCHAVTLSLLLTGWAREVARPLHERLERNVASFRAALRDFEARGAP
jgi:hypothetical protein